MQCPWCRTENSLDADLCGSCGRPYLAPRHVVSGRYELAAALGYGGMGVVWSAHDLVLDERVAIKLMAGPGGSLELSGRLRQEIRLAHRVSHENVCRIHEYGEDGRLRYISMELVEGSDLKRLFASAPPPMQVAFDIGLQSLAGLEAIHRAGIVHRDLKSSNLMRTRDGVVKVMDFGIAKALEESATALTRSGEIVGSPEYMSPEQARGEKLDPRSDVYSMGIVLFEMLTGHVPFRGDSPLATLLKHISEPPPLGGPAAMRLPRPVLDVLRTALAKSPGDRYDTARRFADALREASAATESVQAQATVTAPTPAPTPALTAAPANTPAGGSPAPLTRAAPARFPTRAYAAIGATAALLAVAATAFVLKQAPSSGTGTLPPRSPEVAVTAAAPSPQAPSRAPSTESTPLSRPRRAAVDTSTGRPSASAAPPAEASTQVAALAPTPAVLPVGTELVVTITSEIRSDRARAGAPFTALLAAPLVHDGLERVPPGAALAGRIVRAGSPVQASGLPFLELVLTQVDVGGEPVPLRTGLYRLAPPPHERGGPAVTAVIVGAALGALAGSATGDPAGALGGGGAGAALAARLSSAAHESSREYRFGSRLTFRLAEPLAVP